MAASDIEVVNLALGHLRQRSIVSFADASIEATQASRFYRQAVDGTLRAFDWAFARTYLVAKPTVPNMSLPGWRYSFEYPADCLAIRELARCRQLDPVKRYRIAAIAGVPRLFANEPVITVIYTARPASPAVFDPEFTLALSFHLAMLLAMPLTGKMELFDTMRKLAANAVSQAEADTANEDTGDVGEEPVPDWLSARGVPSLLRDQRGRGFGLDCYPGWHGDLCVPSVPTTLPSDPPPIDPPVDPPVTYGYVLANEAGVPLTDDFNTLLRLTP